MNNIQSCEFRPYHAGDLDACLRVFDANCPDYFAVNEREEYEDFLKQVKQGYEVGLVNGQLQAAYGVFDCERGKRLNWIMIDPMAQGVGLGRQIMNRAIDILRESPCDLLLIAASHKSAPFFAKFDARTVKTIENGWGPGMHRIDMELKV